jgi:GrpB-like predicted nucleotidyltransferase (UPF0157 family)
MAKPILDILGVVKNIEEVEQRRSDLEYLGFEWKGEFGIKGRRYCVKQDAKKVRILVHLHIFEKNSLEVEKHLLFRDDLCAFPLKADEYNKMKIALAKQFQTDREGYTEAKASFIASVIKSAKNML